MSALEVHSVLQKMAAMRDGGGGWPLGVQMEFQELYTVLEKVQRKVADAEPLVDSRSSAAYSIFLADLRRVALTVDDALDSYSASARRFPFRHKIRHTLTTFTSYFSVVEMRLPIIPLLLMGLKIRIPVPKISSVRSSPQRLRPEQPLAPVLRPKIAGQFEEAGKDVRMLLRLFSTYVADLLQPPEHHQRQQEPGLGVGPHETWSLRHQETDLIGRREDREKVWGILQDDETEVVAIVGMAGVGKTALAMDLYMAARDRGFDYPLWVQVPQDFNPEWIFRQVIAKLSEKLQPREDAESFWWSLNEGLINHKHLLVLDGVWNEDPRRWNELMHLLYGNGSQRTKIIVTTRIPTAAAAIRSAKIYHLQPFSVDHTLRILRRSNRKLLRLLLKKTKKLLGGNATMSAAAAEESNARQVAERCSGLPSIISFMSSSLEELCSREVADPFRHFDKLCAQEESLLHIAEASYSHLPPHVKRCFLYCSLFPHYHIFDADEMISLMAAEGLTQVSSREAQVDGDFGRLLSECFDLVENLGSSNGETTKRYRMHRALHILARHKGEELYKAIVGDHSAVLREHSNIRYMSLTVDHTTKRLPESLTEHTDLRTLILLRTQEMVLSDQKSEIKEIPSDYCRYLTALHVLDLHATKIEKLPETFDMLSNLRYLNICQTDIDKLPESIGRLQYLVYLNISQTCIATIPESIGRIHSLRYLNLSQTDVGKLPDSISALRLLQTLQLSHCEKLTKLPQNIGFVTSLQKLDLEGCYYLSEMPQGISNLKNLKELNVLECPSLDKMPCGLSALTKIEALPRYIATSGDNNPILELRDLVKLKRLGLENIENISNEDAEKIQLQKKHELEHLTLNCNMDAENRKSSSEVKELLDCLEPNPGLKILEIISYAGETFPCWMANTNPQLKKLTQIRIIRLINLKCSSLPPLGQLHQLETLEISGMNAIKNVSSELHGELNADTFRSLKKIVFSHMVNLQCWPVENGAICEHLKELSIIQCPKFHKLSMNLNIEKLTLLMSPHELLGREGLAGVARSLKSLSISLCEELSASSNCEGLTMLSNLEELKNSGCDELENLPPGMENLTALKRLSVIGCQKFQNLTDLLECTALSSLVISDCPMLPSVPQGLRGITTCE